MATVPYGSWGRTEHRVGGRRRWLKLAAVAAVGGVAAWWFMPRQPVAETGAVSGIVTAAGAEAAGESLEGNAALQRCRELLLAAEHKLDAVPTMTAVFQKQERIDEELKPLNVMDLKVRREPLGIYMKWQQPDAGQELIWRQGAFDGKIVVCPAGWRRKVMPMVKVDPEGETAMAVSRRPITNIGIWNFTKRLKESLDSEAVRTPGLEVTMTAGDQISGHPCYRFTFQNRPNAPAGTFHKMVIFFDRELGVPVAFEMYGPTADGAGRLEESYLFRDLQLGVSLAEVDFDHENPAYAFTSK